MSESEMPKCISQKDREFFDYLHAVKVATVNQINENIYKYKVKRVIYKRLKKFEKAGLIQGVYHHEIHPRKVFRLTKKCFKEFVSDGKEQFIQVGSNSIVHDLRLSDIRSRLLNDGIATSFVTENVLQAWGSDLSDPEYFAYAQVNCDGVAEVPVSDGIVRFAVEYEANAKYWKRYDEILNRYYSNSGVPYVIYICDRAKTITNLKSKERTNFSNHKPKIFYITYDDIMFGETIDLTNRNGVCLRIYPKSWRSDLSESEVNSSNT